MIDKQQLKLKKMCQHWADHNISHKESFEKWRKIAQEMNLTEVAENLNKAMEMMDKCNEFLYAARDNIKTE